MQRFLVHLVEARGLARATCDVYAQASRFFCRPWDGAVAPVEIEGGPFIEDPLDDIGRE